MINDNLIWAFDVVLGAAVLGAAQQQAAGIESGIVVPNIVYAKQGCRFLLTCWCLS